MDNPATMDKPLFKTETYNSDHFVSESRQISDQTHQTPSTDSSPFPFDNLEESPLSPLHGQYETASPPKFSNIVIKSFHQAGIDLDVLFNILPIISVSPEEIEKSEDDYNGLFTSVRRFPKSRGYRAPSKIKSFLDFDFYFLNKNFHAKVSTNAISVVGGGSMEKTEKLVETVYYHLISLGERWEKYSSLDSEIVKNTFSWMKTMDLSEFDESRIDPDLSDFLDVIIDRKKENVDERLADLYPLIGRRLYQRKPQMALLINCNSVYNYRLPEEISLKEKSKLLHDKGYQIIFHNCIIIKCFKAIWTCPDTGKTFSFSIQNVGTIKQNSSNSNEDSIKMYEKLVTDLGFTPYFEGASFALKKKIASTESVEKSVIALGILDKYLLVKT